MDNKTDKYNYNKDTKRLEKEYTAQAELQEFIEICDCKEIQDKCINTQDWTCSFCGLLCNDIIVHNCNGHIIKLPTINQLIELLGDRLINIYQIGINYGDKWGCQVEGNAVLYFGHGDHPDTMRKDSYTGNSIRIALAKAVIEINKSEANSQKEVGK